MTDRSGYWLDPASDEYDMISHSLRLCVCEQGIPKNVEIWKIDNLELKAQFEKRTTNLMKLTSWSNSELFSNIDNSVQHICARGFTFPKHGMQFDTGVIDLPIPTNSITATEKKITLISSDIAVGRSIVTDENPATQVLSAGYDSFYITNAPLDTNHDGEFSVSEYANAATFSHRDAK
jgi:hypothetical protein